MPAKFRLIWISVKYCIHLNINISPKLYIHLYLPPPPAPHRIAIGLKFKLIRYFVFLFVRYGNLAPEEILFLQLFLFHRYFPGPLKQASMFLLHTIQTSVFSLLPVYLSQSIHLIWFIFLAIIQYISQEVCKLLREGVKCSCKWYFFFLSNPTFSLLVHKEENDFCCINFTSCNFLLPLTTSRSFCLVGFSLLFVIF